MSGESSSAAGWSSRLDPVRRPESIYPRLDDPRLGEIIETWQGDAVALRPGRAVLIGFPQDAGIQRNRGRPGAAEAPHAIRQWLRKLTPFDGELGIDLTREPPLDLGDVRIAGDLEQSQQALGEVVEAVLEHGAVPIVLGGGHETAYGHYLGYVAGRRAVGIVNIDAHLDVRPCIGQKGNSGTSFRQAIEHPSHPLPGDRYVCIGAQPSCTARAHLQYALEHGCGVRWASQVSGKLEECFVQEINRLKSHECQAYVTIDADAAWVADVPGVSAPNPLGLPGHEIVACARRAGQSSHVASLDLNEICPRYDLDARSSRWAALVVWNFLVGIAERGR